MSVLGLDIGTTGVKAVAVGQDGTALAYGHREYPLVTPMAGWAELDPQVVWQACRQAIRQTVAALDEPPQAIGISALGEAFVPVDAHGRALGNAIVSFDRRSLPEYEAAIVDVGARAFEDATSLRPLPHYAAFKWLWWQRHRPEVYAAAACLIGLGAFVAARLGASPAIDPSLAIRTLLYDPAAGSWAIDLVRRLGMDPDRLPLIRGADASCGTVSAPQARALGLNPGTPIATGGLDQACAAYAADVDGSHAMLSIGTTAVVCLSTAERGDIPLAIPAVPHVAPGRWLAMAGSPAGGSVLRWYRDACMSADTRQRARAPLGFDSIVDSAADNPTSVLFLPHLGGSRVAFDDPAATGAFVGLTYAAGPHDLARAVLDGVAYEVAMLLQRLREADLEVTRLRCVGGASRSRAWMQIISDATALVIDSTATSHAAAFGAARLASALVGRRETSVGPGLATALAPGTPWDVRCPTSFVVEPRSGWHAYHAERFDRFQRTHAALREAAQDARATSAVTL